MDNSIKEIVNIPYTISYTIRKRLQLDNLNELPKEKRPPDLMIWDSPPEEMEEWFDRIYKTKDSKPDGVLIDLREIEK